MPIYDYKCFNCGESFEISHSILEDARTRCPNCKSDGLKRLISRNVGISFKGSGFYINDSSSKSSASD